MRILAFGRKRGFSALAIFLTILLISISPSYAQWTVYDLPNPGWLFDKIHFTSSNEGWAIGSIHGSYGAIDTLFHYFNGTWTAVAPPSVAGDIDLLNAIHFTSPDEGWVVGSGRDSYYTAHWGVLWHYLNGSWTAVTPPDVSTSWELVGVHFTSPDEGWAIGDDWDNSQVVLLHYLDGTWTSVPPPVLPTDCSFDDIHFTSSNEGWAVGSEGSWFGGGVLLHYLDGSWTVVKLPKVSPRWSLSHVYFTSSKEGWAVGGDNVFHKGVLLRYRNGRWKKVSLPKVSDEWDLSAIHFTSPNEGWAVGYDWNNGDWGGVLLHYLNGTWEYVNPLNLTTGWYLNDVYFVSSNEGWAVGFGGVLKYFVPPPDLTGEWISLSKSCKPTKTDERCKLKAKIKIENIGGQDAAATAVKFYLSSDNILDEGTDLFVKRISAGRVSQGMSTIKTFNYSFLTSTFPSANYLIAVVDADNAIAEEDETNNAVVYGPFQ